MPRRPELASMSRSYLKATFSVTMNARGAPICANGTLVFSSWPPTLPT